MSFCCAPVKACTIWPRETLIPCAWARAWLACLGCVCACVCNPSRRAALSATQRWRAYYPCLCPSSALVDESAPGRRNLICRYRTNKRTDTRCA
ncbi:hypothetical protein DE146DRAFT_646730 [Phaeosphaeria sp. MPI-PUGE-AT-0046c]|nr:hypothetical protein DE146DRAFT_646730 [Phaeosphaeria sp. MPI-PUGE-AT-0046c]